MPKFFFRELTRNKDLVVVHCSHNGISSLTETNQDANGGIMWSLDDLPSTQDMRLSLCESLLSVRKVPPKTDSAGSASSLPPLKANRQTPVRRSNSGVAKTA